MDFEMLLLAAPFSFLSPAYHVIPAKAGICRHAAPAARRNLFQIAPIVFPTSLPKGNLPGSSTVYQGENTIQ